MKIDTMEHFSRNFMSITEDLSPHLSFPKKYHQNMNQNIYNKCFKDVL